MNGKETQFYHELRDCITVHLDGQPHHVTRIESNFTSQGIPDLNLCWKGRECWIELKYSDNVLSPMQLSWHQRHRDAGGLTFTLWKKGDKDYIVESNTTIAKAFSINEVVQLIISEMMSNHA